MKSKVLKTVAAVVEQDGRVRLLEKLELKPSQRALVTLLDEDFDVDVNETMLLSEDSLTQDWNNKEEDEAWAYLEQAQ